MDDARQVIETAPAGDFGELVKVRKFVVHTEEVLHEFGPAADPPQLKGYIAAVARRCVAERGSFRWVLSGGRTPEETYRALAEKLHCSRELWGKTHVFWGDERCVPCDHPQSNYLMAKRRLLDFVDIPPQQIHRIPADAPDLRRAVEQYERILPIVPDLIMLGLGEDGHTASLFPHSPALEESERRLALIEAPVEPRARITVTPPVLAAAREVLVLVAGSGKAAALARVFAAEGDYHETPARLVRDAAWFVDKDAAVQIVEMDAAAILEERMG